MTDDTAWIVFDEPINVLRAFDPASCRRWVHEPFIDGDEHALCTATPEGPLLTATAVWRSLVETPLRLDGDMLVVSAATVAVLMAFNWLVTAVVWQRSAWYKQANRLDQATARNRATSTVHALFAAVGAMWALLVVDADGWAYGNPLHHHLEACEVLSAMSIGYFVYDGWHSAKNRLASWPFTLLHHFAALNTYFACQHYGYSSYYPMFLLPMEATTPFINLRWFLAKWGMASSALYFWNGIVILAGWLVFRMLLQAFVLYEFWMRAHFWCPMRKFQMFIPFISIGLLVVLNTYWFVLLVKRSLAHVRGGDSDSDSDTATAAAKSKKRAKSKKTE